MATLKELRAECKAKGIEFTTKHTILQLTNKIKSYQMKKSPVTPEQIEAWKKDHAKVHKISVVVKKDADGNVLDEAVGYLKKPTRNHKATAMSMYAQNKILECGEFLRNNCWLGGDERLKSKGDIADTAAIQANGIIEFMEGELGEA
ncbi:hypothetical protein MAR621_03122 [Maribacter dokdonensis]|uniref:hypothetical protein n=1 Tax=Maribacter dokdonensis TaxID=320912 RepID=UPI001B1DCBF0|nr:hypothetical protein [Maribacter dokdonensis]CAG2532928.1 hypothetical protein MAR621_03122 [Maribacter dokdonensis]